MATTAELLADARDAYHRLATGTAAVTVRDQNGELITYHPTTSRVLAAYIAELERLFAGNRPVLSILFRTSKGL
jgi:gpW